MTSNTHTLATALCLIADSLEESEDSDLIKTTVVVAAERLEKLEQKRDQLAAQLKELQQERDQLKAQVRQLQKQKDQLQLGFDDYKKMQDIADAEIRAQAIEDYAKKLPNSSRSVTIQSFRVALLTYAIKIRSEATE